MLTWMLLLAAAVPDGQDWPQWRGAARDGVWRETGITETFKDGKLPVRWSVPLGGGYSGPTVADGRVYVMDRLKEPKSVERVHCVEWKTGRTIWMKSVEVEYKGFTYTAGPRASVTVHDGRAYALGAAGNLHCYDAADGTLKWKRDLRTEHRIRMPNWGIAASPLMLEMFAPLTASPLAASAAAPQAQTDDLVTPDVYRFFPRLARGLAALFDQVFLQIATPLDAQ